MPLHDTVFANIGYTLAAVIALLGIAMITGWQPLFDLNQFFWRVRLHLNATQDRRLLAALDARRIDPELLGRLSFGLGIAALSIAALIAVGIALRAPFLSVPILYGSLCLYVALCVVFGYAWAGHRSSRRVASLKRRSPGRTAPLPATLAAVVAVAGTGALAMYPDLRDGAIAVTAAMLVMLAGAWQVAIEPAVLSGNDPDVEDAVDKRLRSCRILTIFGLISGTSVATVAFAHMLLPRSATGSFIDIAGLLASASMIVACLTLAANQRNVKPLVGALGAASA
jgi:hypothetical protein